MRINLVQINASDWDAKSLRGLLKASKRADLTVFPELYPFKEYNKPINETLARARLKVASAASPTKAFIAGGYVMEDGHRYNRVYMCQSKNVISYYDKQVPWGEKITVGKHCTIFEWNGKTCIPLICADACPGIKSEEMKRIIAEARELGAGAGVPIVVSTFGADVTGTIWIKSLHYVANNCEAPVVICNFAGWKEQYKSKIEDGGDGKMHYFGGGGSGLFRPGQPKADQFIEPGIISIDLEEGVAEWNAFKS